MSPEQELLLGVELHAPERLRAAIAGGLDPRAPVRGKAPVDWLLEMYTRSPRFAACLQALLDAGARLADPRLAPVLLDDAAALRAAILADPSLVRTTTSLRCAYTPLVGATLLHVAAEFGATAAARVLIEAGADPDARAATDEHGLDGHTPIFHVVNAPGGHASPILRMLLDAGASPATRLRGLTWGRGFEWETTVFDVTPIVYAQLGLLPQMHRGEADVYATIRTLLEAAGRPVPRLANVPNRYLAPPARP